MKTEAQKLREQSNLITNKDKMDIVFNELLLPLLKKVADSKSTELSIYENAYCSNIANRLKQLGIKSDLQYLCRGEMKPYLIEKGFNVSHSCYFTYIRF